MATNTGSPRERGFLETLLSWLPFTGRFSSGPPSECPTLSPLLLALQEAGREELTKSHVTPVLGAARMLSATSMLPVDHLFTALLKTKLVEDLLFLYDEEQSHAHLVIKLGRDVCGHAQIMHGGLTSSIFDETFGALVYVMKQRQLMTSDLAVTANLTTNYRAPIPTQSCLLCTVKVKEITGRKIFLEGAMTHVQDRTHFADASALFINMKVPPPTSGAAESKSKGSMAEGFSAPEGVPKGHVQPSLPVKEWHTSPRYDALCAAINIDL